MKSVENVSRNSALVLISKNREMTLPLSSISIDGILTADLKGQVLNKLSESKSNIYGAVLGLAATTIGLRILMPGTVVQVNMHAFASLTILGQLPSQACN